MNWKSLEEKVRKRDAAVCVVGMGYVGLPLAIAFANKGFKVIGYDVSEKRISELSKGEDSSREVSKEEIMPAKAKGLSFTCDSSSMKPANVIILALPTPVNKALKPDMTALKAASKAVGENMSEGTVVILESTVYPGVTEEIVGPIVADSSGFSLGKDFKLGYSPERINFGDREHNLNTVVKVVSGSDAEALRIVSALYSSIVGAGVHEAENMKTAEAAKVIENIQRDLNIALANELSLIFGKVGISTRKVIEAAATKWNFHKYQPGLVGGHCIPVDPYYLVYKAEELGYNPQVILAGRRINNSMPKHAADMMIKALGSEGKKLKGARVLVLGLTFKKNVKDTRTSRATEVISELKDYGVVPLGCDPLLSDAEITAKFGVQPEHLESARDIDGVMVLTAHNAFKELSFEKLKKISAGKPIVVDACWLFNEDEARKQDIVYRSL